MQVFLPRKLWRRIKADEASTMLVQTSPILKNNDSS